MIKILLSLLLLQSKTFRRGEGEKIQLQHTQQAAATATHPARVQFIIV
jgi:hypothetical protein